MESPLWSNLLLEARPGSISWSTPARWGGQCPPGGSGKGRTRRPLHPGPVGSLPQELFSSPPSQDSSPRSAEPSSCTFTSCFPATCCLVWWSSWWAFPGLHPTGLSLPPRWWCVLTGGVRPVANEGNCSWNYFLNIGSLVPLHLENKPRFLISLSTVCELRTTLAHQKWSCSYCTTWWYFFLNPYSILELQSLF